MALTESEIQAKIDAIHTKLDELQSNPKVDYKIGNKSVSASQYLSQLLKELDYWENKRKAIPKEDISSFETGVSQFGEDESDYVGDD